MLLTVAAAASGEVSVVATYQDNALRVSDSSALTIPRHHAGSYVEWTNERQFVPFRRPKSSAGSDRKRGSTATHMTDPRARAGADPRDERQSLEAAIQEGVSLSPYDTAWPVAFAAERDRLASCLPGRFVAIEHIGSTAVPGMPAKPIIDLLAGVASMTAADEASPLLLQALDTTSAEFNRSLPDRRWFMRWADGRRTHHLHVVVHNGAAWNDRIAFRDALRSDATLASRYAALKQRLAAEFIDDREAYTEAKAGFVRDALPWPPI